MAQMQTQMEIEDGVSDWGSFEKLIFALAPEADRWTRRVHDRGFEL
jgi:hypothetical protein